MQKSKRAFTLIELSIVLVIIGLIVGGVLVGRDLIRAAELRGVISEYQEFASAVTVFRDKYSALPGDMTNATSLWGTATCPGTSTQGSNIVTCNGNGDGRVWMNGATNPTLNELFRFWQHLSNASLIKGNYDGVTGDSGGYFAGGSTRNMPQSRVANAVWLARSEDNSTGSSNGLFYAYDLHLDFLFGGYVAASWPSAPVLKPEEARNIDSKIDDGRPGYGKVLGRVGSNCTDAANNSAFDSNYIISETRKTCHLNFTLK